MTAAPAVATPTLAAAMRALDQLVACAAVCYRAPHDDPQSNLPHLSDLRQTQLGRHALDVLALEAGPVVALPEGKTHVHYGPNCFGIGVAVSAHVPGAVNVRWRCGRSEPMCVENLVLITPGAAFEAARS